MDSVKIVYVMVACQYFRTGMENLVDSPGTRLVFINSVEEIVIDDDSPLTILLVLDMSGAESLKNFMAAVDYLNQIAGKKRVGVMVSRYNSYMTFYLYRRFHGKVTFFNSHNFETGLFVKNFISWLKGKTFQPMHVITRFRDSRYGFSLKEWICLVVPLSGETIQEMSACLKVSEQSIYQVRQNALKKIGISSYRQFCEMFLNGKIGTENDYIKRR